MTDLMADKTVIQAGAAVEDADDDHIDKRNSVHQRLRANSSIMQLKKLLGKAACDGRRRRAS